MSEETNSSASVTYSENINLLLSSVAMEELSLSHIINAEGEKLQYVLGTLTNSEGDPITPPSNITISDILAINTSMNTTLNAVAENQILLTHKLKEIREMLDE